MYVYIYIYIFTHTHTHTHKVCVTGAWDIEGQCQQK